MLVLQRLVLFLVAMAALALPAHATWSILIIDLATGEIAVGIATCLTGLDLKPMTMVVVPGYGVAAAQSFVGPQSLRELIRAEMFNGTSAQQILNMLAAADSGHQSRQYGIASLIGGTVTFTGNAAGAWAGGVTGQVGSLLYTVQGNVLTGAPVVNAAELAIQTTAGSIGDKLMAAMEAAALMGGDGRCSCSSGNPTACGSPPPSFAKSAHIGLMIVSRPSDVDTPCNGSLGCATGNYWMDLNIANQQASAPDPVWQLRQQFNAWKLHQVGRADHFTSTVVLSSNRMRANGVDAVTGTITLRDAQGNLLGTNLPVSVSLSNRSSVTGVTFTPVVAQANGTYQFAMFGNLDAGDAVVDVAVQDAYGRVGIWPQPVVTVDDVFGPCGTGAIPNGVGTALDALKVAGSAGVDRRVTVGYGQPFVLSLDPPGGATGWPVGMYALWAQLGSHAPGAELPVGPSGGALCFTPYPLNPWAPSLLLADSFGLGAYIGTGPAPMAIGIPGVPAVLDAVLQGAMVVNAQGELAATNAVLLSVVPLVPPTITAITPLAPLVGQVVTVLGTNFMYGLQAQLNGSPLVLAAQSPTACSFLMPAGIGCDATLGLRNPGTAWVNRGVNVTPTVSNVPFMSGPAAGGASFLVLGLNLLGASVTINGAPITLISQSATSIFGTTPPGVPGPAAVRVFNQNGCEVWRTYTYL